MAFKKGNMLHTETTSPVKSKHFDIIKATKNMHSMFDGKVIKLGTHRIIDFNCTKLSEYTIST